MKNKSNDNFMDAKLGGLLNQMQQTNNYCSRKQPYG